MKYFKNTELAKIYNVSEKSVRNWITAAQNGKLDLTLFEEDGKTAIANITKNVEIIQELVEKGKKYKNSRGFKVIRPTARFYDLYSEKQIADIIANLDIYRESPLQYTYFNSGAKRWDSYVKKLEEHGGSNSLTNTLQLLHLSKDYLDALTEKYPSINIVDLGVGNAMPIRPVLGHFLASEKLNRYIGIDISRELLDIALENINGWYGSSLTAEGHVRDITYDRFDDLIVPESFTDADSLNTNLVFLLGGTMSNLREPSRAFQAIRDSMGKNDILVFTKKLDSERSRRYFEMTAQGNQELELVLELLGIDPSLYTLDPIFDETNMMRKLEAKLKVAVALRFTLYGKERTIEINKGEGILLWRARHQSAIQSMQEFDANGFDVLYGTRSIDGDYLMVIARIKTNR